MVPPVVCAEFEYGARKSNNYERTIALYNSFLREFQVAPFSKSEAAAYGEIRRQLETAGAAIGPNDLLNAASAYKGGSLVTRNMKEISRVEGLVIEDWIVG